MIIRKYGIELRRLLHGDIEMVRNMRNRPGIMARMHVQEFITPSMQEAWFRSIDNNVNYFFLILFQGRSVGLIQGKNVDFSSRSGEGGIYLWCDRALAEGVAVKASVCFADATFSILMLNAVYAKVRSDNHHAYRHNLALGYVPEAFEQMRLDKDRFLSLAPRLRKICSSGKDTLPTSIQDAEFPDPESCRYLYQGLPDDVRAVFSEKLSGLD